MFGAPNRATIMSSVPGRTSAVPPPAWRGTVLNAGSSLSIGIFFSLMVAGPRRLPAAGAALGPQRARACPAHAADAIANVPPVGSLFAAFLGYNPIATLLGPTGVLKALPAADAAALTGKEFFPHLIAGPFHDGLVIVFIAAAVMSVIGAIATLAGGGKLKAVPTAFSAGEARGDAVLAQADEGIAYRVALAHAEHADRAESEAAAAAAAGPRSDSEAERAR